MTSPAEIQKPQKQRIPYVDIAKGILILLVIIIHSFMIFEPHPVRDIMGFFSRNIILPFFMQAFFFLTGYCASFKKNYLTFLVTDLKTLLLPSILFALVIFCIFRNVTIDGILDIILQLGNQWFLIALFFCKEIVYCLQKIKQEWIRIVIGVVISLTGLILGSKFKEQNPLYLFQALAMVSFLQAGQIAKVHKPRFRKSWFFVICLIYLLVQIFYDLRDASIPWFGVVFRMSVIDIPTTLVLGFIGTYLVIAISRLINRNKIFEHLGKASLVIYLVHWPILRVTYDYCSSYFYSSNYLIFLISWCLIIAFTVAASYLIYCGCNTKHLKWTMGRW